MLFKLFKQYLLKENIAPDHIIEIAFDDRRNKKLRDPDNCLEYVDSKILDQDMHYILLDEVQLMAEFEAKMRELYDEFREEELQRAALKNQYAF